MNYFKSVLAGLVAVLLVCGILPVLLTAIYIFVFMVRHGGDGFGIGFERPRLYAPSIIEWLFIFAIFGSAFFWQLRRQARRRVPPSSSSPNLPTS
jgi:hypothetical protein